MDSRKTEILAWLDAAGVDYELVEHPAAYDMEDIQKYLPEKAGSVCKNLFLRDSRKGKRHLLVSVLGSARVDLGRLGEAVGERLSFASEGRLEKYLHLAKGAVTPLGVFYDETGAVELFFDERLAGLGRVGVHPGVNTATVFLAFEDLCRLMKNRNHAPSFIKVE